MPYFLDFSFRGVCVAPYEDHKFELRYLWFCTPEGRSGESPTVSIILEEGVSELLTDTALSLLIVGIVVFVGGVGIELAPTMGLVEDQIIAFLMVLSDFVDQVFLCDHI